MVSFAGIDLFSVISDIKVFLYGGFQTLPLTMAGTLLLIGLFTANYSVLFFLVGFLVLTPIATMALNGLVPNSWKLDVSDTCNLIEPFPTSAGKTKYLASYWLTMGIFMFSYLITNAVGIYLMPTQYPTNAADADRAMLDQKTMYRKSQMIISLVMLAILMILFLAVRTTSGCDDWRGLVPALPLFGLLGYSWFTVLSTHTGSRLSDLFGVSNRLMSPDSMPDPNTVCLPLS
jgi:hypothetical protein